MKECWINVYEYKTVKNTQFYSHSMPSEQEAIYRAATRKAARPDSKVVYRIHVKMKPVKPLMKMFGVEVPGVHWGDGSNKSNLDDVRRNTIASNLNKGVLWY